MKEFIPNNSQNEETKRTYKPYTFSLNDKNEKIRDLVLKMSRIPLPEREDNASK